MRWSPSCAAVFVEEEDVWECPDCGFRTDDDTEARQHGQTGIEMLMDTLELDD